MFQRTKLKDMMTYEKVLEILAGVICLGYVLLSVFKWHNVVQSTESAEMVLGIMFTLDGLAQVRTQRKSGLIIALVGILFIVIGVAALQ